MNDAVGELMQGEPESGKAMQRWFAALPSRPELKFSSFLRSSVGTSFRTLQRSLSKQRENETLERHPIVSMLERGNDRSLRLQPDRRCAVGGSFLRKCYWGHDRRDA